ncbi:biotin-dependent carboxyltransferase family protein [Arthrobacter sp. EH-1B-1]|uniref:Biotin-dependent carboxyltransferase family protein n=1 Tax=Arthrobacter vasquezii TaxID=2977629 RepID=A0ABT6CRN3_9MICC|nr:biotin-dependent carboxyltransferase family protein [Arthrobacter vasquezii]MDF9276300.1 biotin-dependent carboxyltransferase family protein [Arthrobacter vasquezii]
MSGQILISQPGLSVVTDLGRFAGPKFGLPVNGALDQYSARAANILVGNTDNSPLIEITALDFRMTPQTDLLIAVTGAPLQLTVGGRACTQWEPVSVRAGEHVTVRGIHSGIRAYLAIHGSIDAPTLLGSCAPDTVVGFGMQLAEGSVLQASRSVRPVRQPYFDLPLFRIGLQRPTMGSQHLIEVTDGPDITDFGSSSALLFEGPYQVSGRSNHIGLRLSGALPERQSDGEVLSRGVPVGAVEVPSREELLVLHRGRGVTAGYPVLAVATRLGLDSLAQARPGDTVRFKHTTVKAATASYRRAMNQLEALRGSVDAIFAALGIAGDVEPAEPPLRACG